MNLLVQMKNGTEGTSEENFSNDSWKAWGENHCNETSGGKNVMGYKKSRCSGRMILEP